jgi:hypothetical protein
MGAAKTFNFTIYDALDSLHNPLHSPSRVYPKISVLAFSWLWKVLIGKAANYFSEISKPPPSATRPPLRNNNEVFRRFLRALYVMKIVECEP